MCAPTRDDLAARWRASWDKAWLRFLAEGGGAGRGVGTRTGEGRGGGGEGQGGKAMHGGADAGWLYSDHDSRNRMWR